MLAKDVMIHGAHGVTEDAPIQEVASLLRHTSPSRGEGKSNNQNTSENECYSGEARKIR